MCLDPSTSTSLLFHLDTSTTPQRNDHQRVHICFNLVRPFLIHFLQDSGLALT